MKSIQKVYIYKNNSHYFFKSDTTENVNLDNNEHINRYISKEMIKKRGVCFNQYSINNGYNQFCRDIKRFNSKEEMLGFVIGYNEAINNN